MNTNNTMSKREFIIAHIFWAVLAWIWYKYLLFRRLTQYSEIESKLFLLCLVAACFIIGAFLEIKRQRNRISIAMNLLTAFGVYAVITYLPIKRNLIIITIIIALILAAAYSLLIILYRIKQKNNKKAILKSRLTRALRSSRNIICVGFALVMASVGIELVFSDSIVATLVDPTEQIADDVWTIENNLDALALLLDENWISMEAEEKLNVLQVVANIERQCLGIPHELNVVALNLDETVGGHYYDPEHKIAVNIDCMIDASAEELVNTITHEAFHAAERRIVDAYDEVSDESKQLRFFAEALQYKAEFSEYIKGSE